MLQLYLSLFKKRCLGKYQQEKWDSHNHNKRDQGLVIAIFLTEYQDSFKKVLKEFKTNPS